MATRKETSYTLERRDSLAPVSNLRILIHPLFIQDEARIKPQYQAARNRLLDYAVNHFIPTTPSEVTLVMPNGEIEDESGAQQPSHFPSHKNLDKFLKEKTSQPANIMRVPDLFSMHRYSNWDILNILKKAGFTTDHRTITTVGGEWVDACVKAVVKNLLTSLFFSKLRLDKHAVIGSSCYGGLILPEDHTKNIAAFKNAFLFNPNYSVVEDDNFIHIKSKKAK